MQKYAQSVCVVYSYRREFSVTESNRRAKPENTSHEDTQNYVQIETWYIERE